jgi:WXXGXW repeat (2 copies)
MRRLYTLVSLLPALAMISPAPSFAQLVSITIAPPVLPVYVQPAIPAPGYMWTPGYWAYGGEGYFWVPGTWVLPPSVGVLWTPGYWGWSSGVYAWNAGYWGPTIGFYGGVNYGYGYGGVGYGGGAWQGGVFSYNRTVNNFGSVNITNVYSKTVIVNNTSRVAFNGGTGGIAARPTLQEEAAMREQHTPATALQTQHEHTASTTRENLASVNHGAPTVAATSKPGEFSGRGVVGARGALPGGPAGAAGGLAKGPGSIPANSLANRGANPLGSTAPKGPGATPLNAAPKGPANALATTGPAGAGSNAPNREFKSVNPGNPGNPGGAQTGNPKPPGPPAGARPAFAAQPHPVAAAPRGPAGPRPPAGGGGHPANHRPG